MKDKKGFILYADTTKATLNELTDEQAGRLFKHIVSYVNDENPITEDPIVKLAFAPIKAQLKRDLDHWNSVRTVRVENGKKGGRPKKLTKAKKPNAFFEKQNNLTKAKKAVIVNVNDNVNVINIQFEDFWNLYDKKLGSKTKCETKWGNLTDEDRATIMQTLPSFLSNIKDKQFQPYPLTYLNNERWKDEPSINEHKPIELNEDWRKEVEWNG